MLDADCMILILIIRYLGQFVWTGTFKIQNEFDEGWP